MYIGVSALVVDVNSKHEGANKELKYIIVELYTFWYY